MIIPDDARRELYTLQKSMTPERYLQEIWRQRDKGRTKKSRGTWPIDRAQNVVAIRRTKIK